MGFNAGSPYYKSSADGGGIGGTDCINITFTPESDDSSWLGASEHNGATKAFAKVKEGLNEESLHKKAVAWQKVATVHETYDTDLTAAAKAIFEKPGVWEGDDADAALKIFNGTLASSGSLKDYTANMSKNVAAIHSAVVEAKGVSSHGGSSGFAGTGWGGGGGDGSQDTAAYMKMAQAIDSGRQQMPMKIEYQNKPSADTPQSAGQHQGGPGGPGSTGAGVGGASSASHVKGPSTTGIKSPGDLPHPTTIHGPGSDPGSHPGGVDPITTPGSPGTSGYPGSSSDPGSFGSPSLTGGSTLAGYDPGATGGFASGGGAGGFGGGVGSVGGGAGSLAAGAGGLSGTGIGGIGAGVGAGSIGGVGSGAGGVGSGVRGGAAAEGAGGAAANGRGGTGAMMPMRGGGGAGGGDDERERSTWLEEDDDVWGAADEVPPSTIS